MHIRFLFLIVSLISGCNIVQPFESPSNKQIDAWVKQEQFSRALYAIKNNPETVSKKKIGQITALAGKYDNKKAREIRKKINAGEWEDARNLLTQALNNYPEGKKLNIAQNLLDSKKTRNLRQLEAQMLLARAEWLLKKIRILGQVVRTDPNDISTTWKLNDVKSETSGTATELYRLGKTALDDHELDTADLCLTMADRLMPSTETTISLARLEDIRYKEKLKRRQKEQRIARGRQLEKNKRLIKEAYSAIASNNLVHALGLFAEIRKINTQNNDIQKLGQSLKAATQSKVKSLLDEGSNYYSNDNIKKAKLIWEKALKLEPKNKMIRERIRRADRVLEKLKQIKTKD